jgi:hypothetical protein
MEKREIIKIADILLETSRQDSTDKSRNKAYTEFDMDTIFKYGCDRLNAATELHNKGYVRIELVIDLLEYFNGKGDNTYAIKLIKNRFMNNSQKGE